MLTRRFKAGYGVADFGLSGAELLLQLYLLEFYLRVVGLSPLWAGVALALAVLWDAVTDPVMGALVDRTRTRWGRFQPYLVAGALVFAIGLVVLFNPPTAISGGFEVSAAGGETAGDRAANQPLAFLYLLCSYVLVNTGVTLIGVPHLAMGGALSKDTHERTELYGWRLIFGTLGLFAGILAPLLVVQALHLDVVQVADFARSRSGGSWLMAAAVLGSAAVTVAATAKGSRRLAAVRVDFHWLQFRRDLCAVLGNRLFVPFYLAFLLVAMARAMNATLALPYYKDSLRMSESVIQGPVLSTFALAIVASVPLWILAGRRFGKKLPAFVGMATLGAMTIVAYPLFPPGAVTGPVVAAIIGGIAVGAVILVEAMVPDIADEHYVRSGDDHEGLYFGLWRMGQKVARSVMLGLTGWLLHLIGYEEGLMQQSDETARRLAWTFGLGPGSLFFAAAMIFLLVPLSRQRQEQIQHARALRRQGRDPSVD